ncbi:helix-turn-helix transcriptional regulator [Stenotrophomonas indicatrix]|uniref:helix-turn-helix transcriptional regulator n=1 Tax=Stenotrophomonas indicatrix TaxID=2045451 RepID=UPI0013D98220|nr:AlpA family transcriptional regulator [Stenotrophomonas indicatrix]
MSSTDQIPTSRLLRRSEVMLRVGMAKSTLYSRISAGTFPKPVPVGCSVRWVESEVEAWISERIAARDKDPSNGGTSGGISPSDGPSDVAA